MGNLRDNFCPVFVHNIGQCLKTWYKPVVRQTKGYGIGKIFVDSGNAQDNKTHAPFGPGFMVIHEFLGNSTVGIGKTRCHRGHGYAIFYLH